MNPVAWVVAVTTIFGVGVWVGSVNSDRKNFKEFMQEVRTKLDRLLQRLPRQTLATGSPLQLTELGEEISEQLGALAIAKEAVQSVLDEARGKSAYQIQELSFVYFQQRYKPDPDLERRMQDCAFENGIQIGQIQEVFAVHLRDELLKELKET